MEERWRVGAGLMEGRGGGGGADGREVGSGGGADGREKWGVGVGLMEGRGGEWERG